MMVLAMIAASCDDHGSGGVVVDAAPFLDVSTSGRACAFAMQNDPTAVGSPALECPSRTCVHVNGFTPDQCTAECERAEDCVNAPESLCLAGYTCTPVVSSGPFACRNFCVCADRAPTTACL
jgi:hypothetical protein